MNVLLPLGLVILVAGAAAASFPRPRTPLIRLINIEIAAWGLLLILLTYAEALALLTFVAVTAISTFVLVRILERSDAV